MDSCVTAAVAARDYELAMLHLNYGQKTQGREERAFLEICDFYGVPDSRRLISSIDYLKAIGGSSLTDDRIPVSHADLSRHDIPPSYVPFRNAHILSIGVSWAEVLRAAALFIGAVEEDSSGYPDCRESFFRAFNEVIRLGTRPDSHIRIVTPVIAMNKHEIVRRGVELGAPFHLTWSCYQREDQACGVCDSCALRLRGFQRAGVKDPVPYVQYASYIE
jgi:7-cyano-7-deazaguanine synthase